MTPEHDPTVDTVSLGETEIPRPRLTRGVCVGRYVVIDGVGEGGMGVVYKAYDPELERAVALKLLHGVVGTESSPSSGRRERLLREAKALARLAHPNVLAVFDVGTFENDVFLATEFVEGPTLGDWLREKKHPRAEVLRVLGDAGEGLAAAHRAGLVHRDFKPSNVIMGKDGRVRVLDFGLARSEPSDPMLRSAAFGASLAGSSSTTGVATAILSAKDNGPPRDVTTLADAPESAPRAGESSTTPPPRSSDTPGPASLRSAGLLDVTITQLGQILGTPRFMAPEQHLGRTADARSDQFSFCVTLYDALYGELPFDGRGDEYAANLVNGRVRNAPAGADVPRRLRLLLLRGLSVAPGDRYASMDELLAELRRDPSVTRRRWAGGAATLGILLAAALASRQARPVVEPPCRGAEKKLAGVWDDARKGTVRAAFERAGGARATDVFDRTARALDQYAHGWVAMHTDACEATQVRGEQSAETLDLRVECLGERLEELRAQVDVYERADAGTFEKAVQAAHGLPRLDACADTAGLRAPVRPPADPQVRARVDAVRAQIAQARAHQRAGDYGTALALATRSADEATALAYRPLEAEALYVLGDVQDDEGSYAAAEHTLRRSTAAALAGHHETLASRALVALVSEVGLGQARFGEAHEWAILAEGAVERTGEPFAKGELARNVGRLLVREGKFEEAQASIERCLAAWTPQRAENEDAIGGALTDLGNALVDQGKTEEAIAKYAESLAILEKSLGPDNPALAPDLNNLGELHVTRGEYALAVPALERARAIWERAFGPDHPKVALVLYNLARARRAQGDVAGGEELAEKALAAWQSAHADAPEHPDLALGLHGVAEARRAKGDLAGALAAEQKALAIREKVFGANDTDVAESLLSIGETRLAQKRAALAVPLLERAVRIQEADASDAMALGDARFALARALGTTERARVLAGTAREAYGKETAPLAKERAAQVDAWLGRGP